jgi:hypothetical protein
MKTNDLVIDNALYSYKFFVTFLSLFFVIILILFATNMKGFNKIFGYEMLITGPFLIFMGLLVREIIVFKTDPLNSYFTYFEISSESWFFPALIIGTIVFAILTIIIILGIGDFFSNKKETLNVHVLLNLIIICICIVVGISIYGTILQKDSLKVNNYSKSLNEIYFGRTRYLFYFVLLLLFVFILYVTNPGGIMTKYGTPSLFFILFIGIILILLITIYTIFANKPSNTSSNSSMPGFLLFFSKGIYILFAIGFSLSLIYVFLKTTGMFEQDASKPETWGYWFFNMFLFSLMIGLIYKLLNIGGYLSKNPYFLLVTNTLLYLPCLLVSLMERVQNLTKQTTVSAKPFEKQMLLLSVFLLGSYFVWITIGKESLQRLNLQKGGKQVINMPIDTNKLTNVISYQKLNEKEKGFQYKYALSFWFFIDSFPPKTNSSQSIFSYAQNPNVLYNATTNTLSITVKQTNNKELNLEDIEEWNTTKDKISFVKRMNIPQESDNEGNRIIYEDKNVLLQKWNHLLLNYNGGTLDVFYNGELVKSSVEVVPYMKFDMLTIGSENGVSGSVANVMYFQHPLDYYTINFLYKSLKESNPPILPANEEKIVS